jgi:hypothetical protein
MRRINAAMHDRDLVLLRRLLLESEVIDDDLTQLSMGERLRWAEQELGRLDALLTASELSMTQIRQSASFKLWSRTQDGEPVIELLRHELQTEIAELQGHLTLLIATYMELIEPARSRNGR